MPRKPITESEITMAICFNIMSSWKFDYNRRRYWTIWAARHRVCPDCGARTYSPCLNLADQRLGKEPRINRQPHDARVDWARFLGGLKQRGLYRPILEHQVRKREVPE